MKPKHIFLTLIVVVSLAALPSRALAIEVPPIGSLVYVQTNGPSGAIGLGDWYSSIANGATPGYHYFEIDIPCGWPSSAPVNVDLFSPEMNANAPLNDEVGVGGPLNTTFEMYPAGTAIGPAPDVPGPGAGIPGSQTTFTPSGAPETWVRYYTLPAPVACGAYVLRSQASAADQNSWRLRVGLDTDNDPTNPPPANSDNPDGLLGTNDEIAIGVTQVSYQHNVLAPPVDQCLTLYEYVGPGQASVTFHNFDMDGNQRVQYYSPADVYDPTGTTGGTPGTTSTNAVWNGGTTTNRGTGDVIANPLSGWWRIVSCVNNNNQFIQEGQFGVPMYHTQPTAPVMVVTKDDGLTTTGPNAVLTYTLNFTNTSNTTPNPGAATNVTLTDALPANTTYVSCAIMAPFTGTCAQGPVGTVTFTLNQAVNAGATGAVQVTVQVGPTAGGTVTNSVCLDYQDSVGNPYTPVCANDVDTIAPTPTPTDTPLLSATPTATPTFTPGGGSSTPTQTPSSAGATDTPAPAATQTPTRTATPSSAGLLPLTGIGPGWREGVIEALLLLLAALLPVGVWQALRWRRRSR